MYLAILVPSHHIKAIISFKVKEANKIAGRLSSFLPTIILTVFFFFYKMKKAPIVFNHFGHLL